MIDLSVFARARRSEVLHGDAREALRLLPDASAQCVVTSPPYFGLRDYGGPDLAWADGWVGQLGLEPTPDLYVAHLLEVFAEVWRVLRDDGAMWMNLGDCYASKSTYNAGQTLATENEWKQDPSSRRPNVYYRDVGLKAKDLVGVPWMVAFALRAAGWYLRADVIWRKPNPMPSSVRDRPTSSHEYVFLLVKRPRYHYDWLAVVEPFVDARQGRDRAKISSERNRGGRADGFTKPNDVDPSANGGKNRRSVWTAPEDLWSQFVAWLDSGAPGLTDVWDISTKPFKEAHFAVFPPELASVCARATTSPTACGVCGAPWRRLVNKRERDAEVKDASNQKISETVRPDRQRHGERRGAAGGQTMLQYDHSSAGFEPTCAHRDPTGRCLVVDPFAGASTVGLAAAELGLDYVGCELVEDYVEMGRTRLASATM